MINRTQQPSQEDIAHHAYLIYQRKGCQPGNELQDWLEAEAMLNSQNAIKAQAAVNVHTPPSPPAARPEMQRSGKRHK